MSNEYYRKFGDNKELLTIFNLINSPKDLFISGRYIAKVYIKINHSYKEVLPDLKLSAAYVQQNLIKLTPEQELKFKLLS